MTKLVAISGYDAALPDAYQGRALGVRGCAGCAGHGVGSSGLGKLYTFSTQPFQVPGGTTIPASSMQIDIPIEQMAADASASSRLERWGMTAAASVAIILGMWLVVGKR